MTIIFAKKREEWLPVLVDFEDGERIGAHRLSMSGDGYAAICPVGRTSVKLHRWLMGCVKGDGKVVDHINGDVLDCRRSNMRITDRVGNMQNVSARGVSRFRGVCRNGSGWQARFTFRGVHYYLGTFPTEELAGAAAEAKRVELIPDYRPR